MKDSARLQIMTSIIPDLNSNNIFKKEVIYTQLYFELYFESNWENY